MTWTRLERVAVDYAIAAGVDLTWADTNLPQDAKDAVFNACHAWRSGTHCWVVNARLALHLRLLRRVEAWERGEECQPRMTPWHPLWLDAPTHDPTITPRMRREAREARRWKP